MWWNSLEILKDYLMQYQQNISDFDIRDAPIFFNVSEIADDFNSQFLWLICLFLSHLCNYED
jgi:hypothetical protein